MSASSKNMPSKKRTPKLGCALLCAVLTACGTPGPPLPPSLNLPQPVSDLKAVRKGDKVTLTWTIPTETTDGLTVRDSGATNICRELEDKPSNCGAPVGKASPTKRPQPGTSARTAAYTDTLPVDVQQRASNTLVTYAVEVLSGNNRSAGLSNTVPVLTAPTMPPPTGVETQVSASGVSIKWQGLLLSLAASPVSHVYRVYRQAEGSQLKVLVGTSIVGMEAAPTILDSNIEWEKTYEYRVTVATVVTLRRPSGLQMLSNTKMCDDDAAARKAGPALPPCSESVEGEDSPPVTVVARDSFPPVVPAGLQAAYAGAGQLPFVDLNWSANTDGDLAGYNIYRHEASQQSTKINADLIRTPAYRDDSVAAGKTFFYCVTSVDIRGNESAKSEEASETVPAQ